MDIQIVADAIAFALKITSVVFAGLGIYYGKCGRYDRAAFNMAFAAWMTA